MNSGQSYGTGVVFVLLATLGWSLSGIFVRLMPGLDGWQIICWRGYWMSIALLVYLVVIYGRETVAKFRAIPAAALFISATFFAVTSAIYVTSLTLVSTATISVIGASSPLFTGLFSPWITGEKPGVVAWLAALLALVGVGIIAWDGLEGGKLIGILVSLCFPLGFAGNTLALRRYRSVDMVPAICVGGFLTFFAGGIIGSFVGKPSGGFDVSLYDMMLLAVMGLLQLAIPLAFFVRGSMSVPAVTLALIVMLDAVLNPLWPWFFVGEMPETAAFIGGTIVICAVIISIFGGRWMARKPA